MRPALLVCGLLVAPLASAQTYDLLLAGGHVIDPANNINGPMDVAIAAGKIARVAKSIPRSQAPGKLEHRVLRRSCWLDAGHLPCHHVAR